jgi:hypothetical protein
MDIKRVGSSASTKGPAEYFTGGVRIDPLFPANAPARAAGNAVTFEPGARTLGIRTRSVRSSSSPPGAAARSARAARSRTFAPATLWCSLLARNIGMAPPPPPP